MDANTLAKYIGKEHVEEVQTLMENDSQTVSGRCKRLRLQASAVPSDVRRVVDR